MSLETAGTFVLDFIADEDAKAAADLAYLQAVADVARARGVDVSTAELEDAFHAVLALDADDDEVNGFTAHGGTITIDVQPFANTVTSRAATVSVYPVAGRASLGLGGWSLFGSAR